MLGVSHAATVGFNFQTTYCTAASYSGAVVTAPAFGIPTNSWESLLPIETGYGCDSAHSPLQNLSEVIDTTTSTNGLNPLPNGSLTLNWSAYTGNVSGFGGYSRPGPHYTFGGNGYTPGNEQVYWGFLRDGVNFGPGSSGGDNDQPGYSIEITGLKSLFTNTPFVVQLIASADSMQTLTNAFVIDATGNTTQSVVYPSTPTVGDAGGAAWVRGVGGGLSTMTPNALDTDHIKIIGNRAAHGGDKNAGGDYDMASTIAGFIITDKPVLSMPPNQNVICPGDTVTWAGYAVGVPPLSYQWRHNGAAIPGATTTTFSITNVSSANSGSYDLLVTNAYGSAVSGPLAIDQIVPSLVNNLVLDSNPSGVERDGLASGATWLASSGTHSGVMSFNGANHDQIIVAGQTNFDTSVGAITFWLRSSGLANPTGNPAILFDRRTSDGLVIGVATNGSLIVQTANNANRFDSGTAVLDGAWHLVTLDFSQANGEQLVLYVDGSAVFFNANAANWSWPAKQQIELGTSHDSFWQSFDGVLDDVRYYNRQLTDPEVLSIFNSSALVDTNALVMRLNFDAAPSQGLSLSWKCTDAVLQSATAVSGPYTSQPAVVSPYAISVNGSSKFYRYTGHTGTNIVTNPYLM